jgi:hypothetical protein
MLPRVPQNPALDSGFKWRWSSIMSIESIMKMRVVDRSSHCCADSSLAIGRHEVTQSGQHRRPDSHRAVDFYQPLYLFFYHVALIFFLSLDHVGPVFSINHVARKINQWVRLHYINGSLLLISSNYSEIRPKLSCSAEPNDYMPALSLAASLL